MSLQAIKERVAALLEIANRESTNENEAATALAMAQRVILKYKLDIAECLAAGKEFNNNNEAIIKDGTPLILTKRLAVWQINLGVALANANDCKLLVQSGLGLLIYGRKSDISNVRMMLSFCMQQLWNLSPKGRGKIYSDSWYLGAIYSIRRKLEIMRSETLKGVTTYGLIKLNELPKQVDEFIQSTEKVGKAKKHNNSVDYEGYFHGQEDGHNINFSKGELA